jgi:hypothetical protein
MLKKLEATFECDNCQAISTNEFEIREGGLEIPKGWGLIGWDVHTAKHACSEDCWNKIYDKERDLLKEKTNPYKQDKHKQYDGQSICQGTPEEAKS